MGFVIGVFPVGLWLCVCCCLGSAFLRSPLVHVGRGACGLFGPSVSPLPVVVFGLLLAAAVMNRGCPARLPTVLRFLSALLGGQEVL